MRRPAHGGTSRPGPARPAGGFGRPVRSRPLSIGSDEHATDPAWWFERELELEMTLEDREPGRSTEPA